MVYMYRYVRGKNELFNKELLSSKLFLTILLLYVLLKSVTNLGCGASFSIAVRSGILGVIMYVFGYYIINLFSVENDRIDKVFWINDKTAKAGFIVFPLYFVFLFIKIVDGLQRKELVKGEPFLSHIPGYDRFTVIISGMSNSIAEVASFIEPYEIYNIITGNIFYVIIPLILFTLIGYSFKGIWSFKNSRASWPILGFYTISFLVNGLTVSGLWKVIYSTLYPGLCEEFFHRAIVVRTTFGIFNGSATSLVAGTLFFSLIHFPDYYFRIYGGSFLLTLSSMGDVFMYGLLLAYGFRKTGTLLPWILIHALSE